MATPSLLFPFVTLVQQSTMLIHYHCSSIRKAADGENARTTHQLFLSHDFIVCLERWNSRRKRGWTKDVDVFVLQIYAELMMSMNLI